MSAFGSLRERQAEIASKHLVVGFDGFIDSIVRPVRQAATNDSPALTFDTIGEFGEFLVGCAGKSCSVELKAEARQLGGNLPIFSRSAGILGLDVTCIGMLGEDGIIEQPFQEMPCKLHSFAAPGLSTAFEFQDGKVLFASDYTLPREPWQMVLEATGGKAPELFRSSDLIALLNWSELSFAQKLWESVYTEALADGPWDKTRFAFFDLCDCSRKTDDEIECVLQLIGRFATHRTAVLSVNENEAHVIASRVLGCRLNSLVIANTLRERYAIDEILVHTVHESLLISQRGQTLLPTEYVERPKISTGAGDNFNAAFCCGTLMGMTDEEKIRFANRYTSFYVSNGYSPSLEQILASESDN